MSSLFKNSFVWVWLLLVVATGVSWWLGTGHTVTVQDDQASATIGLMLVAFLKVRFVGIHFMELGHAPTAMRWVFEGWLLVACGMIIGLYLGAA